MMGDHPEVCGRQDGAATDITRDGLGEPWMVYLMRAHAVVLLVHTMGEWYR